MFSSNCANGKRPLYQPDVDKAAVCVISRHIQGATTPCRTEYHVWFPVENPGTDGADSQL